MLIGDGFDFISVSFLGLSMPSEIYEMAILGDCQQSLWSPPSANGGFLAVAVIMGVAW